MFYSAVQAQLGCCRKMTSYNTHHTKKTANQPSVPRRGGGKKNITNNIIHNACRVFRLIDSSRATPKGMAYFQNETKIYRMTRGRTRFGNEGRKVKDAANNDQLKPIHCCFAYRVGPKNGPQKWVRYQVLLLYSTAVCCIMGLRIHCSLCEKNTLCIFL